MLHFVARGLRNTAIASRAFLNINTVKTYIRTAYRTIGGTRSQAVAEPSTTDSARTDGSTPCACPASEEMSSEEEALQLLQDVAFEVLATLKRLHSQ